MKRKNEKELNYAVFDIESTNWTKFLIGDIFTGTDHFIFKDCKKMFFAFDEIAVKTGIKTFYAHNGGKFDLYFFISDFIDKYLIEMFELQGRIIKLKVMNEDFVEIFSIYDSMNFIKGSLNKFSKEILGLEKLEIDYNDLTSDIKKTTDYLKQDCELLYDLIKVVFDKIGITGMTIGQMSMKIYNKDFEGSKKQLIQSLPITEKYIRDNFLYGGRVEIFKRYWKGDLYYYDVNSLYPFVMRNNYYPVGKCFNSVKFNKDLLGLYEIEFLETKQLDISFIPKRIFNSIYYVSPKIGETFYLTTNELKELNRINIKYKIKNGIIWEKKEKIFTKYVDYFYSRKQLKDNFSIIYKLLLNSLYGKFSQKRDREIIRNFILESNCESKDLPIIYFEEKLIKTKETSKFNRNIHPEISVFVTSYARLYMQKFFNRYKDNIIYSDTDSILMNCKLDKKYCSESQIGLFKLEGKFNEGIFINAKNYAVRNKDSEKIVFKGFNNKSFVFNDFMNYFYKDVKIKEKREILKSPLKNKSLKFEVKEVTKELKNIIIKRDLENNKSLFTDQIKGI